ncbi:MAG: tRNA(His) guanylyltransferase Thg1 family protein [Fimbriimonadaceae bacterium]
MKFDVLDAKMRVYETAHDHCVLPGVWMVARLDGRGFTRLTKELHAFEAPYDQRFRDLMSDTCVHLMQCGFQALYAYTQSDEISVLLHRDESAFGRKLRKLNSVLAGEASAIFSLGLQALGVFDCRICQFPTYVLVVEYFRWRQEDAARNALNAHCYWAIRNEGLSVAEATSKSEGLTTAQKNELLFQSGINFNEVPNWQKRGIGHYWQSYDKVGTNPLTGESVATSRRRVVVDLELPMKEAYDEFIAQFES